MPLQMATIPTIHLNGTGFTTLRDEYAAAYDAIEKAMEALAAAILNGRDYYPQEPGAYYKARAERDEALDKLRDASIYVGESLAVDKIKLMGVTDRLIDHPSAKKFGVNKMWGNYINSLIIDDNGELAENEIRGKCKLIGIDFDEASSPVAIKEELSYDEQSRLFSAEANSLVQSIRHSFDPFIHLEDSQAYRKVWTKLNSLAGIKNFPKATLDEKEKWLHVARAWKAEQMKVAA